jgi:alanyl-tRNA synthetase
VHFEKITKQQLERIERRVNETIFEGIDVIVESMDIEEAKKMGATALFGEKYAEVVRVVNMGGFSMELCGGCHIDNTSKIGMFKILSEGSVASGVRRIEAVTGFSAYEYTKNNEEVLNEIAKLTKTNVSAVVSKVQDMHDNIKELTKTVEEYKNALSKDIFEDLSGSMTDVNGIKFLASAVNNMSLDDLRTLSDKAKDKYPSCVVALASSKEGQSMMIITASKAVVQKGFNSGAAIKQAAAAVGGFGGGRADMAQAGIAEVANINKAFEIIKNIVENLK